MQILKGRNVEFPFNIALFVGSNEENGMRDIQAYVKKYPQPKLNLVPDGGFPVAYCGTGGMRLWLTSNTPVEGLTLDGGHADAPGLARAVFDDGRVFTEEEAPGHSAKTKTDNVFAKLLLRLPKVKEQDVLDYLIAVATAEDGKVLGITHEDEDLGATIVRPTKLRTVDGKPGIYVRLRYPYGLTEQDVIAAVTETAAEHGFTAGDFMSTVPPFKYSLEDPYLKLLWETSEEVIGNGKAPFREMGGTYAHHLHNGFIYGMNGNLRPEDYPEGRGSAHSRDELVSISRLQRAMRIYARLLLKLSETGI